MSKTVLIVSYYWPPAGGPGVQRWLKFATYLSSNNITPIVYTPENPSYPILDPELLKETPEVTVLKYPIREPYKWAKLLSKKRTNTVSKGIISNQHASLVERFMLFIRGNFFIPDARKSWVKPSINYLSDYLSNNHVDAIITTGPPHSMHLIGLGLQKRFKLPWFADFRDPWTTIGYHRKLKLTTWAASKHKQLERLVLNSADQIIVTSPSTKDEFSSITTKPIQVITNGYDQELNKTQTKGLDKRFSLSHIGSLLSGRNPQILWDSLHELNSEIPGFKDDLLLRFVGFVAPEIKLSLAQSGLNDNVAYTGYVAHQKALEYQVNSQLLLLIEIDSQHTKCIIPGKLFEYFMAQRPILAIGPYGSDIEGLIQETNTGAFFYYLQKEALKNHILKAYTLYKSNSLDVASTNLERYSRTALTKDLAALIQEFI